MPGAAVPLLFKAVATFAVKAAGSFIIKTAASYALGSALTAMSKRKTPAQERQAQVSTLSLGEVAREAVFGIAATGGSLVDVFNWGGQYGTDRVTFCIALADHVCDGMEGYFVGDEWHPWTGNGPQAAFNGKLILEFRNARADGWAPPSEAVENGGWTATDRGCSVTHIWVTWISDEKVWPQGVPQFRWVPRGLHPFDPRRGDHDPEDPETWTFSRNPILERYTYARGIYATGHHGEPEHLLIGRGLSVEEAPPARIIAAANLCDEDIDGLSRYYADGVVSADMDFIDVEELFAAAVAGVIVQREGGVEIEPGQAKAVVVTITDDDLVTDGETIEFSEFRPDGDGGRINTVIPRFTSVRHGFRDHSGPVRRDLADIIADGGPRELTLSMPFVTGEGVSDRNAEIARRLARFEGRGGITLPPEFSRLEEGDWIAWTSQRRFGGATRRFRIEAYSRNAARRNRLSLREIGASAFGEAEPIADPVPAPPAPPVIDALTLPGAAVQAITLAGETSVIPAVRATWDTPVDAAVNRVRLEVRIAGDTDASPTLFEDVVAGVGIGTNGVAADQVLQARLVPMGDPSRPVLPSPWVTVTTEPLTAGDAITWGGRPSTEFDRLLGGARDQAEEILRLANDRVAGMLRERLDRVREARDTLDRLTLLADIDPVDGSVVVRRETMFEDETGTGASTLTVIRSQLQQAIALSALELRTYTDGEIAEATAALVTIATLNGALASADLALRSYTDGQIAEATATLATVAALNDAVAAADLALRSYTDGQISEATASLATLTALNNAVAAADLELRSWTNGRISQATAGLATTAELNTAISNVRVDAESFVNDYRSEANLTFTTAAQFNALTGPSGVITVLQNAVATAEGKIELTYGFSLNGGGRVAGMLAVNDGTTSSIDFEADAFRVWSGTASIPAFGIINGQVYIGGNLVGTHSLIENAVTNGAASRTVGKITVPYGVETEVQAVGMTATGAKIRVDLSCLLQRGSLAPDTVNARVTRNGATVFAGVIGRVEGVQRLFVQDGGSLSPDPPYVDVPGYLSATGTAFFIDTDVVPGPAIYRLNIDSAGGVDVSERNLALLEIKR